MTVAPIDLLFESALLLGSICFSLGVLVLAREPANKLNLSYAALASVVAVWALSFFVAGVLGQRVFESIHLVMTLLMAPAAMFFMQVLLRPEGPIFRWCTRLTLFISIVFIPLVVFGFDTYAWIRDVTYFSPALIVIAVAYLHFSEAFGIVKPRGVALSDIRRSDLAKALALRNQWLYIGGAFVTMICTLDRVPWLGRTIPAIGNLLLAAYFYGLKDVVLQRDYANLRRLWGRILADIATALVLTFVFVVTTIWVLQNTLVYVLNVFLVSFLAINSATPIRTLMTVVYQRFFFQEAAKIDLFVKEAEKDLAIAFDRAAIGRCIDRFFEKALGANIRCFYALTDDGKYFEKVYDATPEQRLPRFLSVAYPLVLHWHKFEAWKPVLATELDAEADRSTMTANTVAIRLAHESLSNLESNLALPLIREKQISGFVTLAIDQTNEPVSRSWGILSLFKPFFERAAEALHNLDIYSSLRERERLAVIGEMSAGLAHEIRNPLGAIKGAAQVMELDADDVRQPFVKIIVEEVNRLNDVVTQFLNYAKPFKGEMKFVDLKVLAEDVVRRFLNQHATEINYPLKIQVVEPEDWALAYCQEEPIGRVITNLLENALAGLQASGRPPSEWGLTVRIICAATNETNIFSVVVEDNGVGIRAADLEKVFIPFFSLAKNGTGLGLPICQRIAEAHGGKIEIHSREAEGTRATLRFPSRRQNTMVEV